jgi:NitT/TauT family transport system permease protein
MDTSTPDRLRLDPHVAPTRPPRPTHRLRRLGKVFVQVLLPILGIAVTVALWQWAVGFFEIRPLFLPKPSEILDDLRTIPIHFLEQTQLTVLETLAGFGIGAVAGLLGAALLVASPTIERATLPLVIGLNAIPKVALAPLLSVWLGLGYAPHIALAALICFFPIMIATMAGLTSTPAELGELARSMSASRWRTFVKIRVPWALPQMFVGLKLGMTLALIGTVVGQIARPSGGLGRTILLAGQNSNTTRAFSAIVLLMVVSIVLFYAVVLAERLLLPWARATAAARI